MLLRMQGFAIVLLIGIILKFEMSNAAHSLCKTQACCLSCCSGAEILVSDTGANASEVFPVNLCEQGCAQPKFDCGDLVNIFEVRTCEAGVKFAISGLDLQDGQSAIFPFKVDQSTTLSLCCVVDNDDVSDSGFIFAVDAALTDPVCLNTFSPTQAPTFAGEDPRISEFMRNVVLGSAIGGSFCVCCMAYGAVHENRIGMKEQKKPEDQQVPLRRAKSGDDEEPELGRRYRFSFLERMKEEIAKSELEQEQKENNAPPESDESELTETEKRKKEKKKQTKKEYMERRDRLLLLKRQLRGKHPVHYLDKEKRYEDIGEPTRVPGSHRTRVIAGENSLEISLDSFPVTEDEEQKRAGGEWKFNHESMETTRSGRSLFSSFARILKPSSAYYRRQGNAPDPGAIISKSSIKKETELTL